MARQRPGAGANRDDWNRYYKSLAKAMNQRLVRLEKLSQDPEYEEVTLYAYRDAMHDIKSTFGTSKTRWNETKPPSNFNTLMKTINDLEAFQEKPSSMKSSLISHYQKAADTFNKLYVDQVAETSGGFIGEKLTWADMAKYYSSSSAKKIAEKYDKKASKTVAVAITVVKKAVSEKSLTKLREEIKNNPQVKVVDDILVDKVVKDILKMRGISPTKLF